LTPGRRFEYKPASPLNGAATEAKADGADGTGRFPLFDIVKTQGRDAQAASVHTGSSLKPKAHLASKRVIFALDELCSEGLHGRFGSQLESLILAQNERWRQA
jgi:hypothetical protein